MGAQLQWFLDDSLRQLGERRCCRWVGAAGYLFHGLSAGSSFLRGDQASVSTAGQATEPRDRRHRWCDGVWGECARGISPSAHPACCSEPAGAWDTEAQGTPGSSASQLFLASPQLALSCLGPAHRRARHGHHGWRFRISFGVFFTAVAAAPGLTHSMFSRSGADVGPLWPGQPVSRAPRNGDFYVASSLRLRISK